MFLYRLLKAQKEQGKGIFFLKVAYKVPILYAHVTKRSKPRPNDTVTFYFLLDILKCIRNSVMTEDFALFVCVMAEGSALGIHRVP